MEAVAVAMVSILVVLYCQRMMVCCTAYFIQDRFRIGYHARVDVYGQGISSVITTYTLLWSFTYTVKPEYNGNNTSWNDIKVSRYFDGNRIGFEFGYLLF